MRNDVTLAAGMALGLLCAGQALAGVVIVSEETRLANQKVTTRSIYIESDRVRIDGDRRQMIYRGDLQKFWILDPEQKSYMEMDPQAMQQMRSAMDARMAQAMQGMSPEQRQQMQAMMGQHGGAMGGGAMGGPPAPVQSSWEKTGEGKTVGQWSCTVYRKTDNGTLVADLCITPSATLGLTRDDLKVFVSMGEFVKQLGPRMPSRSPVMQLDQQTKAIGFEGLPVETVTYAEGNAVMKSDIKSLEHKTNPPDLFELPAGYTKQSFGMGPGMGPGMGGMHHGPTSPD